MLHPMKYLHPKNMSYFAPFWSTPHPWAMLHTAELYVAPYQATMCSFFQLRCTLWATQHPLSYAAPTPLSCAAFYWATLHPYGHPTELNCTLLSYLSSWWATTPAHCTLLNYPTCTQHPTELCCTLLNYAESYEQCWTLLSHGALHWAMLHLTELCCTYWAALNLIEIRGTLLSYVCTLLSYSAPCDLRCTLNELHKVPVFMKFFKCWNAGLSGTGLRVPQSGAGMLRVLDWDAGCWNTDAGGIGLNADAQLCFWL
jgi:hypothetical protein